MTLNCFSRMELITDSDVLCFVNGIVSDFGYDAELDYFDDDTNYYVMVNTDGDFVKELHMSNAMKKAGFRFVDCNDTTYWFY